MQIDLRPVFASQTSSAKGLIVEQKSFLRSFIERIVVNHPEAKIDYNIPIIDNKGRTSRSDVLTGYKLAPRAGWSIEPLLL